MPVNAADRTRELSVLFLGPASSPHVSRWAAHLARSGHRVRLASLHEGPDVPGVEPLEIVSTRHRGATGFRSILEAVPRLRRAVRERPFDVAVAYYLTSYGLLAAVAGLRPLVGAAAGGDVLVDDFDSVPRRIRNRVLLSFVTARLDGALAWAPHVGARLRELGVPSERILVQPRGVDLELFPPRPVRLRAAEEPIRIVSLRWLKPLYRVDTLVEALGQLRAAGIPFEARLVGDGPERARLEARVAELRLAETVRFCGTLDAGGVLEQLRWADVYVSTSSTDGASSSLFEALAVGAYPVVTDIPANRFVLESGGVGRLFATGDVRGLAEHLRALAASGSGHGREVERGWEVVRRDLDYGRNLRRIGEFVDAFAVRAAARTR